MFSHLPTGRSRGVKTSELKLTKGESNRGTNENIEKLLVRIPIPQSNRGTNEKIKTLLVSIPIPHPRA